MSLTSESEIVDELLTFIERTKIPAWRVAYLAALSPSTMKSIILSRKMPDRAGPRRFLTEFLRLNSKAQSAIDIRLCR